jgi:pyrimidine-specific ribonucleoside hydrolase
MLKQYFHEGIPVGVNDSPEIKPANFPGAAAFNWGKETLKSDALAPAALDILKYIYQNSTDSIHFVCLGSLNIIAKAEGAVSDFKSRTAQIIWSCSNFKKKESFNYLLDKDAYKLTSKTQVPLRIIDGSSFNVAVFDENFIADLGSLSVTYSQELAHSLKMQHQVFYDEIVPLWLHYPNFFIATDEDKLQLISLNKDLSEQDLRDAIKKIIKGETVNQNQVMNFSWRKEDYFPDVQPIMDETIKKYGKEEWVAESMANELHRHLGVFAIVGAKMGIRAKEYFNAGIDEIKVLSYAGTIPPFSCMNDGLQVSTGATVGHGLISVSSDSLVRPVADFTYMGKTIRVTLKPEYGKKIASEVKELNKIYGLSSNIYWELIRKLAIKYWANFDRHEIFTIESI